MTLRFRHIRDYAVRAVLVLCTVCLVAPLLVIIGYVLVNGISALTPAFFTEELGSPARAMQGRPTGLFHSIVGTVVIDLLALSFAAPVGMGAGIMLSEYSENPLNGPIRILTGTLNGMPAILMGLLAFSLVVRPTGRFSAVAGSVALAFVMVPIIARSVESVLRTTPWSLREVGLALGLPRWRVIVSTVLPAARSGILTGVLIAFARAAGEAAPLLFTSFGQNYLNLDIRRPMDTLPQRLYSLAISPYQEWHAMGWAAAIVLLLFVMACFLAARALSRAHGGRDA